MCDDHDDDTYYVKLYAIAYAWELLCDHQWPNPEEAAQQREAQQQCYAALYALLSQLTPRQYDVVVSHYGLYGEPAQTFREISRQWGDASHEELAHICREAQWQLQHAKELRQLWWAY